MKFLKVLKDVFIRRHFYQHDYFCQTNTYKECWTALKAFFSRKDYIAEYEQLAAKVMGAKYAKSFATGRHALYVILKSLGIGGGDEVITQGFTCVVVPNAVIYTGATPVYCDIDSSSFNLDYSKLLSKITSKTRAVIVQHTFGNMADVEKVKEIVKKWKNKWNKNLCFTCSSVSSDPFTCIAGDRYKKECIKRRRPVHKIYIIEDFAHAVGCGKLKGDVGFYSSDHTKMISTGTGGMAFTNTTRINNYIWRIWRLLKKESLWIELRKLFTFIVEVAITHPRVYWLLRPLRMLLDKVGMFYFYRDENSKGKPENYPMKLSNFQATVGISQLNKAEELFHKRIKQDRQFYSDSPPLRDILIIPESKSIGRKRIERINKYYVNGVWFNTPIFGCKDFKRVHYEEGSCPVAEGVSKQIVNLPIPLRGGK